MDMKREDARLQAQEQARRRVESQLAVIDGLEFRCNGMSVHGESQHIPECRFFSLRNKHNADWTDAEFAAWRRSLAEASIGGGWHVGAVCEVCFEGTFSRQRLGELRDEREAARLGGLRDE